MLSRILIPTILIVFTFSSCKSSKFEKTPPFKIIKATYNHWVGGQPGVGGINIAFELSDVKETIKFKNVYFKDTKEQLYLRNTDKNTVLTANINTANRENIDLVIHKDASKEYGNKLPNTKLNFPFILKENECVISYSNKEKELFYKLTLVKKSSASYE